MTTRINGNEGPSLPTQIDRVESGRTSEQAKKIASPVKADRVEVSKDADFLSTAIQAAHDTPAIREDKVAQAKKALADGTLGTDADALADALIDRMLDDQK